MTDAPAPGADDAVTKTSAPADAAATCTAGGGPADSPPAPDVIGRFRVLGQLARGGMGIVYRARDPQFDREVAVKVLAGRMAGRMADRPDAVRRFLDEARITGQLQHPSVPPVHEAGTLPDGRPFLVMKLIKGRTLDELLKDLASPAADCGRLLAVFEQVCQAVAYAHAHKVIHRDLKPANVMVGAFGEVQLMDWGLAKVLGDGPDAEPTAATSPDLTEIRTTRDHGSFTQAGSLLGTPAYMPPEQAAGSVEQTDARADVFGLGALLCVVLTGQPPYIGTTAEAVRLMAVRGKVHEAFGRLDACGADPELVALCKRCLAVEPSDRPADAREVATAVSGLRAAAEDRARRADVERTAAEVRVAEQRKRRMVQAALGLTFTALVACGCAFAWWRDRQAADRRAEQDRVDWERAADGAAAESRARQAVESATLLSAELRDKFRFAEAALALDQAAALVPADGPADVRDRLAAARADLAFVQDLDGIRLSRIRGSEKYLGRTLDLADTYAAAFRARGFDPTGPDAAGEGDRVAASPIKRQLVAALDEWSWMESWRRDLSARNQLLAVARRADPGPWSDQFRDPQFRSWVYGHPARAAAMDRLATEADLDAISPHLIALLFQLQGNDAWVAGRPLLTGSSLRYPDNFWVQFEVGYHFLHREPRPAIAISHFRAARALRPDQPIVLVELGDALSQTNDLDGAIAHYKEALRLDPKFSTAHQFLARSLVRKGDLEGAIAGYKQAVQVGPKNSEARNALAWLLATGPDGVRDGQQAVEHATRACELSGWRTPSHIATLAAAFAEAGDFGKAIEYQKRALSSPDYDRQFGTWARTLLEQYVRKRPFRDPAFLPRKAGPPMGEVK